MGDHRADIKIEFSIHGKTYKQSWWINWIDDGDGVDYRIIDWFRECWQDALARYNCRIAEFNREAREKETESCERAELERLQAKYPAGA